MPKDLQIIDHAAYRIILGKDKLMNAKSPSECLPTDFQVKLRNWSRDMRSPENLSETYNNVNHSGTKKKIALLGILKHVTVSSEIITR